jgi:hypothetical protein
VRGLGNHADGKHGGGFGGERVQEVYRVPFCTAFPPSSAALARRVVVCSHSRTRRRILCALTHARAFVAGSEATRLDGRVMLALTVEITPFPTAALAHLKHRAT